MSLAESPLAAPCPADETFMRLIEGTLPSERVRELEAHCDGCPRCARTMSELARAGAPDPPGWLGGRYQVLEPLGAGSTGVVFAALDAKLRRKVAIKRLRDGDGSVAASGALDRRRDRFLREAQLLASLSHPNVLTVHDVGGIDREVYVVTEFVDGCPMSRWVRETEPRPDHRRIIDLYLQVGHGLSAAHQLNVVHRDVKPENILVARNGRVLIGDFGLAGLTGSTESAPAVAGAPAPLTQTGAVLGTPAYMAPELHAGRPADALSDQFAFCMSLYESLHGRRAFGGATADEYVAAVRAGGLTLGLDGVPRAIDRVLSIGLSADPAWRYPSLEALLGALARVRDRAPLPAAWGMASLAVALLGVLAVAVAIARHRPQAPAATSAHATAPRSLAPVASAPAATAATLPVPAPTANAPPARSADPAPPVAHAKSHRPRLPARHLAAAELAAPPGGLAAGHASADPLLLLYMADIAHGDRDGAACLAALDSLPDGAWPASLAEHAQRRRATCEMLRGQCQAGLRRLQPLDGADVARATLLGNCPAGSFPTVEDRLLAVATQADEERYAGNQAARRHALEQILLRQTESPELRTCLRDPTAARACSRRLAMLARAYQVLAEAYLAAGDCAEGAALDVAQSEVKFQSAVLGAGDPALRCRSPRTADVYHQCAAAGAEAERRCLARGAALPAR